MAEKPKITIIKLVRGVCVRNNPETGEVTDGAPGEVHRVPAPIANILIGDGSAVEATDKDLAEFERAQAKAAAKPDPEKKDGNGKNGDQK